MRFGAHVGIAGGVATAPQRAADLGCDCFQLFVSNPRAWRVQALPDGEAEQFREACGELGQTPVVVHVSYLPNIANSDHALWTKSLESMLEQYRIGAQIGADHFVIHPGSHKGKGLEAGVKQIATALDRIFEAVPEGPRLLLENTAGGGNTIGRSPGELGAIFEATNSSERLGVCLDTCHAYAMGIDLRSPTGFATLLKETHAACGKECVKVVHANDSRFSLGTHRDRHAHIGLGELGAAGFERVFAARAMRAMPFILETPIDEDGDTARDLEALRRIAHGDGPIPSPR